MRYAINACLTARNNLIIFYYYTPTEGFSPVNPCLCFAKFKAIVIYLISFKENLSFFVDI